MNFRENLDSMEFKELYNQKIKAAKEGNVEKLKLLHYEFPELFDKKFLYSYLLSEIDKCGMQLTKEISNKLELAISKLQSH